MIAIKWVPFIDDVVEKAARTVVNMDITYVEKMVKYDHNGLEIFQFPRLIYC